MDYLRHRIENNFKILIKRENISLEDVKKFKGLIQKRNKSLNFIQKLLPSNIVDYKNRIERKFYNDFFNQLEKNIENISLSDIHQFENIHTNIAYFDESYENKLAYLKAVLSLNEYKKFGISKLENSNLIPKKDETVVFECDVEVYQIKRVRQTARWHMGWSRTRSSRDGEGYISRGSFSGLSFPISYYTDEASRQGSGMISITNKRIVLMGNTISYSIKLDKINAIDSYGLIGFQIFNDGSFGGRIYKLRKKDFLKAYPILIGILYQEEKAVH